jgi:hypothetical protein
MRPTKIAILAGLLAVLACNLYAQGDIATQLSKMAKENASSYLSPLLSAWGADLNSGIYHSADLHDVLGFDIGVKLGAVIVKDQDRVFDFVMPDQITYQGATLRAGIDYDKVIPGAPTALGAESGIPVKLKSTSLFPFQGQTLFTTPPGYNLKYASLIMPQAAIGLPFGLEVVGRFVPTISLPNNAGKVNFIGVGIRHSIDQYFPLMPVNLAVHFMTQKLTVSDANDNKILGASCIAYGIEVSKSLALLTVYGGYQLEKSSWDVSSYSFSTSTTDLPITIPGFSIKGKNTSRFHAGIRLLLAVVNIHADYSIATQPVLTAGVGVSFR